MNDSYINIGIYKKGKKHSCFLPFFMSLYSFPYSSIISMWMFWPLISPFLSISMI